MNERNSKVKVTGKTFTRGSNDKLWQPYNTSSYKTSKISLDKYKNLVQILRMPLEVRQEVMFVFLQL